MKRATLILLALFLLGAPAASADEAGQKQAVAFVKKFYDWYVPIALKPDLKEDSSNVAIAKRGALFDPPLLKALKEDAEAARKSPGDIVGLDFDPFLNSQDPDDKYVVAEVSEKDGRYLVNVYGLRKGKREKDVSVVAELKPAKDSFVFTNFRYGADGDLVAVLKQLADDRAHPSQ
ncbi:MAG TPA: hypothetical protein VN823_17420 [Stellaceae bacterium]|nr:hypothetical protein [Stellaceae bacterium]